MLKRPLILACGFILLAVASVLLYYGLAMLLLVPGVPGGPYGERARVVYGVVPLVSGLLALAVSTWTAILSRPSTKPADAIKRSIVYAAVGVVLVFAALAANDLYIHVPIHIP